MSIPGDVVPELVFNAVATTALLWYLPRALRQRKNRAVTIVVLGMVLVGLGLNLGGHTITGWQGGFKVD
jgi:hypothetical protein